MSAVWFPAYIGLGSNMNDPVKQLNTALAAIASHENILLISTSDYYETEPYGDVVQEDFVNAVAAVLTTLSAENLLHTLLELELAQGRQRIEHWGPRTLDLDLLVYSGQTSDNEFLKLPHPEMPKREFVLRPFADIAPELLIPKMGRVSTLLDKVVPIKIKKIES